MTQSLSDFIGLIISLVNSFGECNVPPYKVIGAWIREAEASDTTCLSYFWLTLDANCITTIKLNLN